MPFGRRGASYTNTHHTSALHTLSAQEIVGRGQDRLKMLTAAQTYPRGGREEVRVVAAFLQIHHDVEQRHLVALRVERLEVARQNVLVILPVNKITQV